MKKTITLNVDYLDAKKLKKTDELEQREALFKQSLATFKKQMKVFFDTKGIKILQENWTENEIIIEFENTNCELIYEDLRKSDIVSVIDSLVYQNKE